MDLIGITNNPENFKIFHRTFSDEVIKNLTQITNYHNIGNNPIYLHGLFPPYDDFIFNPYFQMITCIIGAFAIQELFDLLLWPYIREYRNKFYRWVLKIILKWR